MKLVNFLRSQKILFKFFFVFAFLGMFLIFFSKISFAQEDWSIQSFQDSITILKTGVVAVDEKITVDFSGSHHGIFRDLPIVYQNGDGQKIYTSIKNVHIVRDGKFEQVSFSSNGNNVRLQIGNPSVLISGNHVYEIQYQVVGVLKSFSDHDELYWNVTGNGWGVPISSVSATVSLASPGITQTACYEGYLSSRESCSVTSASASSTSFIATRHLSPSEGMSIVVGYAKGLFPVLTVAPPKTFFQNLTDPSTVLLFLLISTLGIIGVCILWWEKGRDLWQGDTVSSSSVVTEKTPGTHETVVVEYTPPDNLRPAEIGVLMDQRADTLDVTATIIDLAGRGFLTITEKEKSWIFGSIDYILKKTGKSTKDLLPYEQYLYDKLFEDRSEVAVSELKQHFYTALSEVKSRLYTDVVQKNYFSISPESIRGEYIGGSVVLFIIGGALLFYFSKIAFFYIPIGAGIIVSAVALLLISFIMSRRTALGHELYRRARGYRLFITTAEKYRQKFFENENMFNEILPYAVMFGVTEKFAHAMKDMGIKPAQPSWYYGSRPFNAYYFASSMHSFSSSLSSAIASAPRSSGFSGGGGSGGGFGGGGGGAW